VFCVPRNGIGYLPQVGAAGACRPGCTWPESKKRNSSAISFFVWSEAGSGDEHDAGHGLVCDAYDPVTWMSEKTARPQAALLPTAVNDR